ncbi:PAS domain S-box protein [Candidatus Nitrospira bockiana]
MTSWNKEAERLYGCTPDEALGKPVTLLIPEPILEKELKILDRVKHGERIDHYETVRVGKAGRTLHVSLTRVHSHAECRQWRAPEHF